MLWIKKMFDDKNLYVMEVSLRMGFKANALQENPMIIAKDYIEKLRNSIKSSSRDWSSSDEKATIYDEHFFGTPMLLKVSIELEENLK